MKCHFGRYFLALNLSLQLINDSVVVKAVLFFHPWLGRCAKLVKALAIDEDITFEQITNELFGKAHSKTADAVATTPVVINHKPCVDKAHAKHKQLQHAAMHDTLAPSLTVPNISANQEQASDARFWQANSSKLHGKRDRQVNTSSTAQETDAKQVSTTQPTMIRTSGGDLPLPVRGSLHALGERWFTTGIGSWLWQRSCLCMGQWLGRAYHDLSARRMEDISAQSTRQSAVMTVQKYARRYVIQRKYVAMHHAARVLQAHQRGKKARALVHAQRHISTTPLTLTVRYPIVYTLCMACARIACRIPWLSNYFREAAHRCALDTASSALVKRVQEYRAVEYIVRPIKPIASPVTTVYSDHVAYTQLADCLKALQTHHNRLHALQQLSCCG